MFFYGKKAGRGSLCNGLEKVEKHGEGADAKPRGKIWRSDKNGRVVRPRHWQLHCCRGTFETPKLPPLWPFRQALLFAGKNPAFKWRGHTRWWCWWLWVKRWVLKRRNISVTLSPITPPHCVRPQFYSHAAYIWNSTIIIMISTTVIVGIVSSRSDDHPQIMNIVAKCFRSEAIQEFRPKKCTLHTLYILNTMHNVHTTCSMHKCGPHGKAILHHIISQKSGKRIMYHPQMYSIYAC